MKERKSELEEQLVAIIMTVPKCRFKHHADPGKELPFCIKHLEERIVCGPFMHVCLKCRPFYGEKCGICGIERFACSC